MVAMIRNQLGMSQKALARLAGVPQSTVSRIEGSKRDPNLSTLQKILRALFCNVIIVPLLIEPIDAIRRKQARRVAENTIRYLQGTMSLEEQQPDTKLVQLKNDNIRVYDETAMFVAIKLVPESLVNRITSGNGS